MNESVIFGVYFLISDFLAESLNAKKNWQKNSLILRYSFIQKSSFTYFTKLNSLIILKNILPQHSQKPNHSSIFPAKIFLVGVRK